jgi:hypothetical protein
METSSPSLPRLAFGTGSPRISRSPLIKQEPGDEFARGRARERSLEDVPGPSEYRGRKRSRSGSSEKRRIKQALPRSRSRSSSTESQARARSAERKIFPFIYGFRDRDAEIEIKLENPNSSYRQELERLRAQGIQIFNTEKNNRKKPDNIPAIRAFRDQLKNNSRLKKMPSVALRTYIQNGIQEPILDIYPTTAIQRRTDAQDVFDLDKLDLHRGNPDNLNELTTRDKRHINTRLGQIPQDKQSVFQEADEQLLSAFPEQHLTEAKEVLAKYNKNIFMPALVAVSKTVQRQLAHQATQEERETLKHNEIGYFHNHAEKRLESLCENVFIDDMSSPSWRRGQFVIRPEFNPQAFLSTVWWK